MGAIERWQYQRELTNRDFSMEAVEMRAARQRALRFANGANLNTLAQRNLARADEERRQLVAEHPGIAWECGRLQTIMAMGQENSLCEFWGI